MNRIGNQGAWSYGRVRAKSIAADAREAGAPGVAGGPRARSRRASGTAGHAAPPRVKAAARQKFDTLDEGRLPATLVRKLREFGEGNFLAEATNVLAFGLPGVGKSHALCAVGHALVDRGHSVAALAAKILARLATSELLENDTQQQAALLAVRLVDSLRLEVQ